MFNHRTLWTSHSYLSMLVIEMSKGDDQILTWNLTSNTAGMMWSWAAVRMYSVSLFPVRFILACILWALKPKEALEQSQSWNLLVFHYINTQQINRAVSYNMWNREHGCLQNGCSQNLYLKNILYKLPLVSKTYTQYTFIHLHVLTYICTSIHMHTHIFIHIHT